MIASYLRRRARWAWAGLVPLLMGGCEGAVVGDWHLVEAVPNKQVFSLDHVAFRADGTFSATTTIEGVTTHDQGSYEFDGIKIKLQPRAGGVRVYSASVQMGRLQLTSGKRHVVLEKGKRGG